MGWAWKAHVPTHVPWPGFSPVVMPNSAALWGAWRWGESDWASQLGSATRWDNPRIQVCLRACLWLLVSTRCWPLTVCSSLVLQHLEA